MKYKLEVRSNEWAGILRNGWRPAIAGTLNQTGLSDNEASTYPTLADAEADVAIVWEQEPEDVRIVEVDE